jgi:hypothetical protein
MSSFGYFKIESEDKNIIAFDEGDFDNTDSWIIRLEGNEMYDYEFEALILEFCQPINNTAECWDFLKWLRDEKNIIAKTIEFNWIDNFSKIQERKSR